MSDPNAKRWLADNPNFLASLNDLDRGLAKGGAADALDELSPSAPAPSPVRAATPPAPAAAPRPAAAPARRAVNPARPVASVAHAPRMVAETRLDPPDTFGDTGGAPAPPLAFARSAAPAERPVRRPLLDLFPLSALVAEHPPLPTLGTAVGPQLPPGRPRPAPAPPADTPSLLDAPTYETFYGLREKAFSLSTDPRFFYQSASHERAGQDLLSAIRKRDGIAVLTGPTGMGKTTLCRSVVQEIDRRTVTSLALEPLLSIDDLLKTMLVDFGVISREDLARAPQIARDVLTSTLTSFLESLVSLQSGALVFIDEAQNLPVTLLEELGALLTASSEARTLQLVLVGQPALTSLLKRSELRTLDASVTRRIELGPLGADEIAGYVMHRLSVAGANTRVEFNHVAIARLSELSAGVPSVVNLLCDRALTRGQQSSAGVIDEALIDAATADLDLPSGEERGLLASLLIVAAFALLVLAGAAAALWVSRDAVGRTILQWQNVPAAPDGPVRLLPVPLAPIPPPEISDTQAPDTLQPPPAN